MTVEVAPDLTATADPRLARLLLDYLIENAWKFTGRTSEARIEFGALDRADGRVFFVRDNGAGFDMTFADKLFSPFQRLHNPDEFEGTGVGLAIVKRIIEIHGGRIWLESAPHQGATFYFTLP